MPAISWLRLTPHTPIVLYYSGWGESFLSAFASTARSRGAEPFVQVYPDRLTMAQVAGGHGDAYLRS